MLTDKQPQQYLVSKTSKVVFNINDKVEKTNFYLILGKTIRFINKLRLPSDKLVEIIMN